MDKTVSFHSISQIYVRWIHGSSIMGARCLQNIKLQLPHLSLDALTLTKKKKVRSQKLEISVNYSHQPTSSGLDI